MSVVIERPGGQHRVEWGRLYAGYAEFYKVVQTEEMRERVWKWIADPLHDVKAFIAVADGRPVGLTHYRPFSRPLAASTGCFLDDLFVDPGHRGGRVSEQLIAAVVSEAKTKGWTVVRWITAEDNYRARSVYDRLATRTRWTTYDIKVD